MLHEWFRYLAEGPADAPSTDTGHDIIVAIIGAAAPLTLALGALLTTLRGRRDRTTPPPIPLNSDSATEGHDDPDAAHTAALETFLMRLHYNPNAIVHGQEPFADVHFD